MDLYIAVIDWGFNSSHDPAVITGPTLDALQQLVATTITTTDLDEDEYKTFRQQFTVNTEDPDSVRQWLTDMGNSISAPWVSTYQVHPDGLTQAHGANEI